MAYRADEVKVGLVIVVSLLILAGFVVSILGLRIGEQMVTYTTRLRFAGGIERGTVVRFGGMQVGKVSDVGVSGADDTRIQLTMITAEGVPIKTDSEVFINTIGFLGDYYLEITTGSPGSPLLPPGSEIEAVETTSINEMFSRAQSTLEKVDAAMVIVNERILTEDLAVLRDRIELITDKTVELLTDVNLVFNEDNRRNIGETLSHVNTLVQDSREDVRMTLENFRLASARLESLAATLDSVVGENRNDMELLVEEIRVTVAEVRLMAERIERLMAENADDIAVTIDNLKATTANTRDFSETVSDEPWRLIWRTRQPAKKTTDK